MKDFRPLALFVVLVIAANTLISSWIAAGGESTIAVTGLMWTVGLAAMAALKLSGRSLSELDWSWGPARYHLIAFVLPLIYGVIGYMGAALAGVAGFAESGTGAPFIEAAHFSFLPNAIGFWGALIVLAAVGFVSSMASALGEEIGWRGFLAPRMTMLLGFLGGAVVTGLLWASWHTPLILIGNYNGGGDVRVEIGSFVLMATAMSGVMAWLRLSSQSLWPCATLHASHNLFIQGMFDPLSTRHAGDITMVGEFGIALALAVVLTSAPFWIMGARMKLQSSS